MEQLCEHRTQGIRTRKAPGLSGVTGGKTGVSSRNTRERKRTSIKAGVHQKNKKLLYDTREIRSSSGKAGGIGENTRTRWRNTRKNGRTVEPVPRKSRESRIFIDWIDTKNEQEKRAPQKETYIQRRNYHAGITICHL